MSPVTRALKAGGADQREPSNLVTRRGLLTRRARDGWRFWSLALAVSCFFAVPLFALPVLRWGRDFDRYLIEAESRSSRLPLLIA